MIGKEREYDKLMLRNSIKHAHSLLEEINKMIKINLIIIMILSIIGFLFNSIGLCYGIVNGEIIIIMISIPFIFIFIYCIFKFGGELRDAE